MPDPIEVLSARLDASQAAAAMDNSREILSLACAGSGKSRTLAYRVARLICEGAAPSSIVAFTFTEKAADSIKRRIAEALRSLGQNEATIGAMYVGTIHAFCQQVLGEIDGRLRQYDVLDDNRLLLFLISRYPALGIQPLRQLHARVNGQQAGYFDTIREVSAAWKILNDEILDLEEIEREEPLIGGVLRALAGRLDGDQFMDFSLMVRKVVTAFETGRAGRSRTLRGVRHLLVDEYQDVNSSQESLIRHIHDMGTTLFVVGDDDQAIYSWRGADVQNILTFEQRFKSSRHTLAHNYRSTNAIVSSADRFAAAELGAGRLSKNPSAADPEGPRDFRKLMFGTRAEEADWVASRIRLLLGTRFVERDGTTRGLTPADFAVLMRSTRTEEQTGVPRHEAFTSALQAAGIPFTLEAGGGVFRRPAVAALVEGFKLLRDQSPTREDVERYCEAIVRPTYLQVDLTMLASVFAEWGRLIHGPTAEVRRRVFPQRLVHELLWAFGVGRAPVSREDMRALGLFSRVLQDVEAVYVSVDSTQRFAEILNFLDNVAADEYDISTEDLLNRPDAVTVMTVHKAKGLEFPVVFLVDAQQGRFPTRRSSYDGWLPASSIGNAVRRGSYCGTVEAEARLFYTAITRAERFLYVTSARQLPGGKRAARQSSFAVRLAHDELVTDVDSLPVELVTHPAQRRHEESEIPTSYSEIRYYLKCPRDFEFRRVFGFSPPIPELFGFGRTVHTSIGRLHQESLQSPPTVAEAREVALDTFHLKHVAASRDPEGRPGPYERARESAVRIAESYVREFGADFERAREVETRFEVATGNAVISGAIDLLLKEDERGNVIDARVVDFKSMELAADPEEGTDPEWTDLSLQVQLYAKGAREVLGKAAETGAVHFLKSGDRVDVPVDSAAVSAAMANVEWAVSGIEQQDFPMRPSAEKCAVCDFRLLCSKREEEFARRGGPPPIQTPRGPMMVEALRRQR